jgi:hypothetical protein
MNKNQGFGLTALFLITMAYALTGASAPVGIHVECADAIDNDGDLAVDADDQECIDYPFADGNGESFTPIDDRFTADGGYTMSAYDYWYDALVGGTYTGDPCMLMAGSWYGPNNDGSGAQYDEFSLQFCI